MILILIAIPADANFLNGYALNGSVLVGYVLKIRIGGICIGGIRLRFLLMHTFWMDTHWMDTHSMDTYWWDTCWTDTYWWDIDWWDTYWWDTYCKTCWCKRFEWIRIAWIRTGGIRVERIRIGGIRIGGIRIGGIRFEWICVGYVWCDGYVWDMCGVRYVWDMCGVRYANNLLKNPATKRLSGKKHLADVVRGYFVASNRRTSSAWNIYNWAWHIVAASTFWYLDVIQKGRKRWENLPVSESISPSIPWNLWMDKESVLCVRNLFVFGSFLKGEMQMFFVFGCGYWMAWNTWQVSARESLSPGNKQIDADWHG